MGQWRENRRAEKAFLRTLVSAWHFCALSGQCRDADYDKLEIGGIDTMKKPGSPTTNWEGSATVRSGYSGNPSDRSYLQNPPSTTRSAGIATTPGNVTASRISKSPAK